jgi:osmotically-inducible protein OsmY
MPIPAGSAIPATPVSAPPTAPNKTRVNETPRGGVIRAWWHHLIGHFLAGRAPRVDARDHLGWYQDVPARRAVQSVGGVPSGRLGRLRADEELREDVYHRLRDCQMVRLDLPGITIHARDGVVWLRGHVSSDGKRHRANEVLRGLDGLLELHNELVADIALAAVAMALASDPRTARQRIGVYPDLGVMRLRGIVQTLSAYADAQEIAAAVPLVKQVVNELRVGPDADVLPDLAGVTNNYDLVPGGR